MITSARCSRSTQWPETRIGSTCGALSVILLLFGFLCLLQSPVNVDPPLVSPSPDLRPLPRMAHTFKFMHLMLLCLMLLDTRSRPSALVHSYMFVFTGTRVFSLARAHVFVLTCTGSFFLVRIDSHSLRVCSCSFALHVSFLLICVCSHLFAFIFSCTGSFFRVCIRFHVYAFVFTRTCSFSLVQVHLQLYMYARLILSGTRSC